MLNTTLKALLSTTVFNLLFVVQSFGWNEPDGFMGLKFGQDLRTTLPKCTSSWSPQSGYSEKKRCWEESIDGSYRLYLPGEIGSDTWATGTCQ